MVSLRGVSSFQWSETEQVYPFEKASDGSTLYCKEVYAGNLAANGVRTVAHNIAGFQPDKLFSLKAISTDGSSQWRLPLSAAWPADPSYSCTVGIAANDILFYVGGSAQSNVFVQIIYAK